MKLYLNAQNLIRAFENIILKLMRQVMVIQFLSIFHIGISFKIFTILYTFTMRNPIFNLHIFLSIYVFVCIYVYWLNIIFILIVECDEPKSTHKIVGYLSINFQSNQVIKVVNWKVVDKCITVRFQNNSILCVCAWLLTRMHFSHPHFNCA